MSQFKVLKEWEEKHVGEIVDSADFKEEVTEEMVAGLVQDGTLELYEAPEKTEEEKEEADKKAADDAAADEAAKGTEAGNTVGAPQADGADGTRHSLA